MPGYKGHIAAGLIFGVLLIAGLAFSPLVSALEPIELVRDAVIVLWLAVLFALFPDVDIKSKGQILFYRIFVLLDIVLLTQKLFIEAALLGFLAMLPIISKHRGWTHSIWAMVFVPSPILLVPMYLADDWVLDGLPYYLGAVAGYLSHLVADGVLLRRLRRR